MKPCCNACCKCGEKYATRAPLIKADFTRWTMHLHGLTMAQIAACLWAACAVQAADSPQQQWVRGTLMRVSESVMSPGGLESDKVGSATPRVSGDGSKVVFYSDATFSSAGFEEDNEYHIWM